MNSLTVPEIDVMSDVMIKSRELHIDLNVRLKKTNLQTAERSQVPFPNHNTAER